MVVSDRESYGYLTLLWIIALTWFLFFGGIESCQG